METTAYAFHLTIDSKIIITWSYGWNSNEQDGIVVRTPTVQLAITKENFTMKLLHIQFQGYEKDSYNILFNSPTT